MNVRKGAASLLTAFIKLYAFAVSPLFGRSCRFEPTCSRYAQEAIERHGPWAGLFLIIRRLLRCHPWSKAGWSDPVPERFTAPSLLRYKRRVAVHKGCGGHCGTNHKINKADNNNKNG